MEFGALIHILTAEQFCQIDPRLSSGYIDAALKLRTILSQLDVLMGEIRQGHHLQTLLRGPVAVWTSLICLRLGGLNRGLSSLEPIDQPLHAEGSLALVGVPATAD